MTTQSEERDLIRTLEGPKGTANVYEVIPAGQGIGEMTFEVDLSGDKRVFKTIGEAMAEAEALVGLRA